MVDTVDGLETTGPTLSVRVHDRDAQQFDLSVNDVARAVNTAMLGQKASYLLEGDRVVHIRVRMNTDTTGQMTDLRELPLRALDGRTVQLSQVADLVTEPGQLELHREDLRQPVAISARLEHRDLGSAMAEIMLKLSQDHTLPPSVLEFGGLFQQKKESFQNLFVVLVTAIFLVFIVLLIEFRSFYEPIAIVFGSGPGIVRCRHGVVRDRHVGQHCFFIGRDHWHWRGGKKWYSHAGLGTPIRVVR